jgi:hypothetical protein
MQALKFFFVFYIYIFPLKKRKAHIYTIQISKGSASGPIQNANKSFPILFRWPWSTDDPLSLPHPPTPTPPTSVHHPQPQIPLLHTVHGRRHAQNRHQPCGLALFIDDYRYNVCFILSNKNIFSIHNKQANSSTFHDVLVLCEETMKTDAWFLFFQQYTMGAASGFPHN